MVFKKLGIGHAYKRVVDLLSIRPERCNTNKNIWEYVMSNLSSKAVYCHS